MAALLVAIQNRKPLEYMPTMNKYVATYSLVQYYSDGKKWTTMIVIRHNSTLTLNDIID
jgi:hypothetical protein